MEVEYKGANSLVFKSGTTSLVVDPKLSLVGKKDIKVEGLIELVTNPIFAVTDAEPKITIEGPGEYEVSGISIRGVGANGYSKDEAKVVIYRLDIGGFRVAVLGHIKSPLSDSQLEGLGVVDIVTIPVGGNNYTLNAHEAAAIVRQIDPKVVIPTHYKDEGLHYEVDQDDIDGFLKELGATQHDITDKLKMKPGAVLPVVLTIIEIKRT